MTDRNNAHLQALQERGSHAFWATRLPLCPHCGRTLTLAELPSFGPQSCELACQCPDCMQPLRARVEVQLLFDTSEQMDGAQVADRQQQLPMHVTHRALQGMEVWEFEATQGFLACSA